MVVAAYRYHVERTLEGPQQRYCQPARAENTRRRMVIRRTTEICIIRIRGAVSKWQRAGMDAAGCHARSNPGSQTCGPPSLGREALTGVLWRLATRKAKLT